MGRARVNQRHKDSQGSSDYRLRVRGAEAVPESDIVLRRLEPKVIRVPNFLEWTSQCPKIVAKTPRGTWTSARLRRRLHNLQ